MPHYNPAKDPKVTNGIQEAYGLRIGDVVEYTNEHGKVFAPFDVIGFVQEPHHIDMPEHTVYLNKESYWYPVKPSSLRVLVRRRKLGEVE